MRLHRLAITAFGPYTDTQVVDFDELSAERLFLLHGETGAGKTSLLDAVAFALFGHVPGARDEAKRIRSDQAASDVRTEVELELTVGGERLRIVRSPAQERAKRRGSGTTTEQARVVVEAGDGGRWAPVTTRHQDAGEYLQRRIGMSAEQFFQVVLLPQGEFARFLRAEAEDRVVLLRKLFRTERFDEVEKWFVTQRRAATQALAEADEAVATIAARVCEASGLDAESALGEVTVEWLDARVVAEKSEQAKAEGEWEIAEQALRRAEEGHAAAADLQRRQRRLAEVVAAREAVDRGRAEYGETVAQLERAERALRVQPLLEAHRRCLGELAEANALVVDRSADLVALATDAPVADPGELRAWERRQRDEIVQLDTLLGEAAHQETDRLTLEALTDKRDHVDEQVGLVESEQASLPQRRARNAADHQKARSAAERLPALQERAGGLVDALAAAQDLVALQPRVVSLRAALVEVQERRLAAQQEVLDLRAARLEGMAAELAGALIDGVACQVCGSEDHPRPATSSSPPISREDEERAALGLEAAEQVETAHREELQELTAAVARLEGVSGGRVVEVIEADLQSCRADIAVAERLAAQLEALEAGMAELDAKGGTLAGLLRELVEERGRLTTQIAEVEQRMSGRQRQLDEARGADTSVEARVGRLRLGADRAIALAGALEALARSKRSAATAEGDLEEAAGREGFAGSDAVAAALCPPQRIAELEAKRAAFEEADRGSAALAEDPELVGIELEPAADVVTAAAALAEAQEAQLGIDRRLQRHKQRRADLQRLREQFVRAVTLREPVKLKAQQVASLADLVNGLGQNAKRMRLQSFVLAARLEEVAVAASERLRKMSNGRYCLVHTDEGPSRGRGGLGLDVLDDYSGLTRPTKTLSGGESFMASLALALGLADVVAAEAGGTQLDTLFIDEGFGSLDSETLDAVMDSLDELRKGGRVVGLVSHVEELKARIPSRLRVVPGRNGSKVVLESAP
jgi:exonuclease SbcC